ncbi:MAG: DUF3137 domain-containing protein [Pseudomonadota bacterium]
MRDLDAAWRELEPWLAERETRRKVAVRKLTLGGGAGLAAGLVLALIVAGFGAPLPLILILGALPAIGGLAWGGMAMSALHTEIKEGLNTRLAESFSLSYRRELASGPYFGAFRQHGLAPGGDRRSFEDHFSGQAHGADFELYEAHIEERRRSKNRTYYVTVFRGVLIRIAFPRTIEGVTLVTRDKGMFNALEGWAKKTFSGKKLERIGLVDPHFEKAFEVYGTDQVMARYLLTPSFMERLLRLETRLDGKNVRCVFDEDLSDGQGRGELLIVAETGNQFEPGSLFKPLDDRKRVERLHGEIVLIDEIIQTVLEPASFGNG